jgi:hypothetical protein
MAPAPIIATRTFPGRFLPAGARLLFFALDLDPVMRFSFADRRQRR